MCRKETFAYPNDLFYTTDEIIDSYGSEYEFFIKDTLLVKNAEIYKEYVEEDAVETFSSNGIISVGKKILKDLIGNASIYKYILAHMDNEYGIAAKIALFEDGKIVKGFSITRAELAELLNQIDSNELNSIQQMRKALINNLSTDYSFQQKYSDKTHKCNIDGKDIEINVSVLIEILSMDEEEFLHFVKDKKKYEYSKEILSYMLVDFIQRERVFEKYNLPLEQLNRYQSIENFEIIDFEYINKNQKTNDYDIDGNSLVDQVIINEELYTEIMKNIKSEYSPLEKAIQVYINMCELLTYDPVFFAVNQKGEEKEKHKNLSYISSISLKNNRVVCYEFVMIYTKILKEFGIDFTINSLSGYGEGHTNLTFRYSEYLISVDSVENIIPNDMANAKINAPLTGLKSINNNSVSKRKFDELVYKILSEHIRQKENRKLFKESLEEYKEKYANTKLDTKEKLYVLLKDIARKDLKGMDTISYQRLVFKNIFECSNNIAINFISSMVNTYNDFSYTPISIVSILTVDGYSYLLIDPNNSSIIDSVSKEELEDMFESGYYAYVSVTNKKIPGLELKGGKSYVR